MQIEVTTDQNIAAHGANIDRISADVEAALERFADRLTRIEVHLADDNAGKPGKDDKRCTLEARPAGQQPVAVTNHADTVDDALDGALRKLDSLLNSRFGKQDNSKGGASVRHPEGP